MLYSTHYMEHNNTPALKDYLSQLLRPTQWIKSDASIALVRICGGRGQATTLVYPTAGLNRSNLITALVVGYSS